MENKKPLASLSLDLDNQWSYMKTHGDPGWELFPSYLELVVPRILHFLKQRDLKITFFIVGQDAALRKNRDIIRSITEEGHEVGNHSFSHDAWLQLYTEQQFEMDLNQAEEHIINTTGQKPIGFRGPGYSLSEIALKVLIKKGYLYDASTLPTFIGPIARAYYFATSKLSSKEKYERSLLFGTIRDGLRPIKPYRWVDETCGDIVEIPVTTMPIFRVPIHVSYILYISTFSTALAISYFQLALWLFKLTNVSPSLLLHPLDFLDGNDVKGLSFFPAMKLPKERKKKILNKIMHLYSSQFSVEPLNTYVRKISQTLSLPAIEPHSALNMPAFIKGK
jgi:peptidoglycan-N-acetylglucosamine deacetylase